MKFKPLKIGELVAPIPIIQGGMGIGISLGGLAGAVAKEGAIGIISSAQIGFNDPEFGKNPIAANLKAIKNEFNKARTIAPQGIIGFNMMVAMKNYAEYVREAVKAGADLIISGAGLPTELPEYVKGSKTKIAPIVSTNKSVRVILKFWDKKHGRTADMVVIEGPKAGGHLGFSSEELEKYTKEVYQEEIKSICETVKQYSEKYNCDIPVVVAGGISNAEEMEEVMNLGVQGVQIATPFVTTVECDADIRYKETFVKAKKEDIQIVKSPVGMPGRAIKNQMIETIMSGTRIPPKKCYGCIHTCNPAETLYCITEALMNTARGNVEEALLFCGSEAYKAEEINTVKDVIQMYVGA